MFIAEEILKKFRLENDYDYENYRYVTDDSLMDLQIACEDACISDYYDDCGSYDPNHTYIFNDGSELTIHNPRQSAYQAFATASYEDKSVF